MITRETDYCQQYARAMLGDREAAKVAILRARRFGPIQRDEAVNLWVAWAGPVTAAGLPLSAKSSQQVRKLSALVRDKLCIAGPCADMLDVYNWIWFLAARGDLCLYTDEHGGFAFDLIRVPVPRESPPAEGFP